MSASNPDIQSILAALAAQRPPAGAPGQTPPGAPQAYPPPPASAPPGVYPTAALSAPLYPPASHGLPAPSSSGNVDISGIRPVTSGTMSFDDVMSKARALAAEKGVASYDRPIVYSNDSRSTDRYDGGRPRTPPRDDYHGGGGSYRDDRRSGHDREQGRGGARDRSFSPGPRGNRPFSPRGGGGARERSPLRGNGGDENSETIEIEASLVGLIIGRQGENLRRIEGESSCRVQFLPASDGGPFRQCKITGPRHRRAEVKSAIKRIIDDSGMGSMARSQDKPREPARSNATALRDGEDHMQIMVPDRTVGLIIGRGGETIRDLQERSGCHINIVGEAKSVNGLRPVNLIGTKEAAARAKDAILEIVDSDSRGDGAIAVKKFAGSGGAPRDHPSRDSYGNDSYGTGGGQDKINDTVHVPSEAVGMIIGKGGETIREMQNQTGCKVNVAQSSGPGEVQREIVLIGSRDSIARAKQAIEEKVDAVRQKSGGGDGGRGRGGYHGGHDQNAYSTAASSAAPGNPPAPGGAAAPPAPGGPDPYAQYGGYENYVALWYQSLMYQQQQGGQGSS